MSEIKKIIEKHDQAIRQGLERGVLVSAEMLMELAGQPVEDQEPAPEEPEDHDDKKAKKAK